MLDQSSSEQGVPAAPENSQPVAVNPASDEVTPQQQVQAAHQKVVGAATTVSGLLGKTGQLVTGKPLQPQPNVSMDEKIWAALSYIPMVAVVSVVIKPQSDYVKLHARQGLFLFLLFIASILLYVLLFPLGAVLGGLLQLALFVVGVFSLYQAIIGNWWKIPALGDIAEKIPVEKLVSVTTEVVTGQSAPQQNDQNGSDNSAQK